MTRSASSYVCTSPYPASRIIRRMRSESWTFIWQPNVRMQAVRVSPTAWPLAPRRDAGFVEIRTGVAVRGVCAVSLIVFLRLVDAGSQRDLARATLQLEVARLEVARPRRPP